LLPQPQHLKKIVNKQKLENNFMVAEGITCEEKAKNNNNRQYALLLHHSPYSDKPWALCRFLSFPMIIALLHLKKGKIIGRVDWHCLKDDSPCAL